MNKKLLSAGAALLLGGCASVEMAPYTVTSFAEIPLKKQAKVKMVAGADAMTPLVASLKSEFAKSGTFKVVEDGADYWFVLNGAEQYAAGKPQNTVAIVKKESARGGTETFADVPLNSASAAKGVSVAVYDAKTLAPVNYLEVLLYSGDNAKGSVRAAATYSAAFSKDVVERVKDAFITQQKQVETPMPLEADGELRDLFSECGEAFAADPKNKKVYEPFLNKYKQLGTINLAKLCEQLRTKTYEGDDADKLLGNYYLFLLVKEALTLDPGELAKVKDQQLMILRASDAKGLAESVPVALARLEYKLANLAD